MRKNIRRSLIVAAAASGIWTLGTAAASAAELPVSADSVTGTVEKADKGGLTGTVEETTQTVRETTEGVTGGITGKLPSKGIPENGLPTNTLPTDGLNRTVEGTVEGVRGHLPVDARDAAGRAAGTVGDVKGEAGEALEGTGHADKAGKAVKEVQREAGSAAGDLPGAPALGGLPGVDVAPLPPRTLPAPALPPVPQIPGVPSAPATGDLVSGLAGAGVRPELVTDRLSGEHAQQTVATVQAGVSTARPLVDRAGSTVLPAYGSHLALHAQLVAGRAAADVAVTADAAASTSAPFAESTVHRTHTLAGGAHTAGGDVAAHLHAFGAGACDDAVPYAAQLSAGAHANVNGAVVHVVSGVRVVEAPSTRDLTDIANVPGLPSHRLPAVPTV